MSASSNPIRPDPARPCATSSHTRAPGVPGTPASEAKAYSPTAALSGWRRNITAGDETRSPETGTKRASVAAPVSASTRCGAHAPSVSAAEIT